MHAQRTVVHHAIVKVNIVIGVVLGEVLVAHVVPLVVIGLALSLIAHVVIVVFVVAILHRIFLYGRYTLYIIKLEFLSAASRAEMADVEQM